MVRAPCCEKMGLKKGPWTPQEDQVLISFINKYGHGNWRALPKQAGLLRCGKSCRLRWINYLRPDIKRGNFSREEEDHIIQLHEMLGNRWSAIAARLPGRTDNEIKNVWHTHLKKRLINSNGQKPENISKKPSAKDDDIFSKKRHEIKGSTSSASSTETDHHSEITSSNSNNDMSNQSSSSDVTSNCFEQERNDNKAKLIVDEEINDSQMLESTDYIFSDIIDESFWSEEALSGDHQDSDNYNNNNIPAEYFSDEKSEDPLLFHQEDMNILQDMDFWYDIFIKAGGTPELPEF